MLQADHGDFPKLLPRLATRPFNLVVFNLGYLPGGDHAITTTAGSTLTALDALLPHMAERAAFSIIAYRGHPGGETEADAIEAWATQQADGPWRWAKHEPSGAKDRIPPVWHWLARGSI